MSNWIADSEKLERGLHHGQIGIWRWQIGTDHLEWTENLEQVHRMMPGSFDGTLSSFRRDLHSEDSARVWEAISSSVDSGEPYAVVYRSAKASDGKPFWIEARGGIVIGENGERYLTGVCFDVTDRITSENELSRRLKQQESIQRLSSHALEPVTFTDILQCSVETAAQVFDVPLTKVLQFVDAADELKLVAGIGWSENLVGRAVVGVDRDSQAGFTLMSSSPIVVADLTREERFSGPPLLREHGVRSGMSAIIAGSSSRPFGVLGIHDRKVRSFDRHDVAALTSIANIIAQAVRHNDADERQRLILREMAHRSGNLLQVVASLATQTFQIHTDRQAALNSFTSRLASLSRANFMITRGGWGPTRLRSLIEDVLEAYLDRIEIEGRDIQLPADLAFDLALLLHELATNSLKYGSLSVHSGNVHLSWRIERAGDETHFALEWCDSQTVEAQAQAQGTGFGSKLKRILVENKWGGTISVTSQGPYNFSCSIPLPNTEPLPGADPLT